MNCLLRTVLIALALTALLALVVALGTAQADLNAATDGSVGQNPGDAGVFIVALVIGALLLALGVWVERLYRLAS